MVSNGCTRKKLTAVRIGQADYFDQNNNGIVDAGDAISVLFSRNVVVNSASPASFVLPVAGDTLGTGATVGQLSPGSRSIEITLGTNVTLTIDQLFSATLVAPGSPSGHQTRTATLQCVRETPGRGHPGARQHPVGKWKCLT